MDLQIDGLSEPVELGSGANGIVYRARQTELDRLVAVKVVRLAHDPDSLRRFDRERRTMASISLHPGIAPIFSSGLTASGQPYLVMPYYPAGSLADRIEQAGPVPWPEAIDLVIQVANAIEHAHGFGVLHRDIKPANILLDPGGRPVLVDFGIATLADRAGSTTTGIHMTPAFAPPEAFDGAAPSRQFDVYSLGATLHALIAGQTPFTTEGGLAAIGAMKVIGPPPSLRHMAPAAVCDCIERAMAAEPSQRIQSAAGLAAELERARAAGPATGVPATGAPATTDPLATRRAPLDQWDPPVASSPQPEPASFTPPSQVPPAPHPGSGPLGGAPPPPQSFTAPAPYSNPGPYSSQAFPPPVPHAPPVVPPPASPPLFQAQAHQPTLHHSTSGPQPPPTYRSGASRSWALPAAVAAGLLVILGGAVVWLLLPDGDDDIETIGTSTSLPDDTSTSLGSDDGRTDPSDPPTSPSTNVDAEEEATGVATAEELATGDCIDVPIDSGIFDTVDRRSCTEAHNSEVLGVLEHPDAGGDYPGQEVLGEYSFTFCEPIFERYVGVSEFSTELYSYGLTPTFDEWADGIYVVPCVTSRWDFGDLTASVEGRATDPTISLDPGDAIPLHRLAIGICFDLLDESDASGLQRQDGLQQAVRLGDCADAFHAAEITGSADLVGTADGTYNFGVLVDEAVPKCEEQFTIHTGRAPMEADELFPIVPDQIEWESSARYTICIVFNGNSEAGSLAGTT